MDATAPLELDPSDAPAPDRSAEPAGFLVEATAAVRIHFLDWGGPDDAAAGRDDPAVLLIHGLGATAWAWIAVARRLRRRRRVVAIDLRGHGLSDAPTEGYAPGDLVEDVRAVADGAALDRVVLAGHGAGAEVAAWTAATLGERCRGLVLVDGGWQDVAAATGLEPWELLRTLDEPPEVLRSMTAFLADRRAFDPATWDADQERAARASVIELPAGRVEPATHDHVRRAFVEVRYAFGPVAVLAGVDAPITVLSAADDAGGEHDRSLLATAEAVARAGHPPLRVARFPADGHNLLRYRPAEVAAAILTVDGPVARTESPV